MKAMMTAKAAMGIMSHTSFTLIFSTAVKYEKVMVIIF